MTLPTGTSYTYTYDSYHNVKKATSGTGVEGTFTYDTKGKNTTVQIGPATKPIESKADINTLAKARLNI